MKLYNFVLGFVALGIAACAAFFSVVGIATFLGGNFIEIAVMASFLEAGKLVCASAAWRYRDIAGYKLRSALVTFTVIMMFITSTGIFGFLSTSYRQASAEMDIEQQRVQNLESRKQTFQNSLERLRSDRERLIGERKDLRSLQAEQGWLSEVDNSRLQQIPTRLDSLNGEITAVQDSVLAYEQRITNTESEQTASAKLGPVMFVADSVGLDPDQAALYFILLLVFVFDPMAVTLVIALSMATGIDEVDSEAGETPTTTSDRDLSHYLRSRVEIPERLAKSSEQNHEAQRSKEEAEERDDEFFEWLEGTEEQQQEEGDDPNLQVPDPQKQGSFKKPWDSVVN